MDHVTLTMALLGWFVILQLGHDMVYLCIKFDDSCFSHSRGIIWVPKFEIGHVTLIMPILRVIYHPYAGT